MYAIHFCTLKALGAHKLLNLLVVSIVSNDFLSHLNSPDFILCQCAWKVETVKKKCVPKIYTKCRTGSSWNTISAPCADQPNRIARRSFARATWNKAWYTPTRIFMLFYIENIYIYIQSSHWTTWKLWPEDVHWRQEVGVVHRETILRCGCSTRGETITRCACSTRGETITPLFV